MRLKIFVPVLLACIIICLGYEFSLAQSKEDKAGVNVGAVNTSKVMQQCKRGAAYQQQLKADQDKVMAELKELKEEMELKQKGLEMFEAGSEDYNKLLKETLEVQAKFEAKKEYEERRLKARDEAWTREIYTDFLNAVSEIAKSKGLVMVVEKKDIDDKTSLDEIMASTRPMIYSGGCVDISAEVLAVLEKSGN